ncbi:ABC transporter ATP-binding protein [Streptomyces hoynatensis]|uniref:ABC transporter ATP-binding protein n=1 Tax=Streptomyces hoynatensis TaxID=1141874 RepID=A0A3A9Z9Z5_9ACTN|nr:ABC transporter ATP-binding protein [Streptomyces hoynatensis]
MPALRDLARAAGLRRFVAGALLWLPVSVIPLASGLVMKALFDRISDGQRAGLDQALWLCAAFVGVEAVRGVLLWVAWTHGVYWWNAAVTVLRVNVMRTILTGGTRRLPRSSGGAVSRLRDDVEDLAQLADNAVPLLGTAVFSAGALAIMATIDPLVTLVLVLPMIAVAVLSRALHRVVRRLHAHARERGMAVTAHIGQIFSGVLTIKAAGAEPALLERLRRHNRGRREAAVRDRLVTSMLDGATNATVEISLGVVLLLAAPSMRRGEFTVGDFALFTSYIGWLTALPRVVGSTLYRLPQASVAIDRLTALMGEGSSPADLSRPTQIWFRGAPPPAAAPPEREELHVLEARGLTVDHGGGGRGVHKVDLRLPRGSFTVVTGAVGAGKTTLLHGLLGLVPLDAGEILWNGRVVEDPGAFMVPGRVAYVGQVPRLFSGSLRENLLLGWPADAQATGRALGRAVFERDLAGMPEGLDTVVGPRGMRLSGGQAQRVTAARALVREPELLVVDDLSSALDVETERLLWRRNTGGTLLVVSHRRAVLERADRIVVLERGRVAGEGRLGELLADCAEMRRLWEADAAGQRPVAD